MANDVNETFQQSSVTYIFNKDINRKSVVFGSGKTKIQRDDIKRI